MSSFLFCFGVLCIPALFDNINVFAVLCLCASETFVFFFLCFIPFVCTVRQRYCFSIVYMSSGVLICFFSLSFLTCLHFFSNLGSSVSR